ncbi:MAG TPA: ATP synthase F1 subunit delta [Prolixibacteraceae bacterium]|nr:ATP synthase F1 subunit delta [Prolixibacteraceae bacterium]
MDQSKVNVRYAKAFFSLAKEKGLTAELQNDALLVSSVCSSVRDFNILIESPVISTTGKVKAIKSIFEAKVHPYTLNFLLLITENRRESFIPGIFRYLMDLYRKSEGVSSAVLTTARELDPSVTGQIREALERTSGGKVELSQVTDPELIGGFVLRLEDQQYDASVATQLKKIRQKLLDTELKLKND